MPSNHKNILGTEMEWAIMARRTGAKEFLPLNGEKQMPLHSSLPKEHLPEGLYAHGGYVSNGSRYYCDTGSKVEYATPENISLDDAVLSEIAGERVVAESLRRFIAESSVIDEAILYKRVIDDEGTSWGYHVNVSEEREYFISSTSGYHISLKEKLRPLVMHYATSLVMLGSGAVIMGQNKEGEYTYSLGQKVLDVKNDILNQTTSNKPFISTRDESLMNDSKYFRLHVVGTDPHVSPWATKMLMGTTTLMLTGIRQNKVRDLDYITPSESPGAAVARRATFDIEGTNKYKFFVNGKTKRYSDSDIQEMYLADLASVTDKSPDQEWAYREWARAVEDRQRDVMQLDGRSDAITKLALIRKVNQRHEREENSIGEDAVRLDKAYSAMIHVTKEKALTSDVATLTQKTLPGILRRSVFAEHTPSEPDIKDRMFNAPSSTRAHKRGEKLKEVAASDGATFVSLNWNNYSVKRGGVYENATLDPWQST